MSLTDEQIKEALKSQAVKDAIAEAVDAATEGLKNKNKELLGSIREEKDSKKELTERLEALENDKKKVERDALAKTGDIEKITQSLKDDHAKELAKRDAEVAKLQGQLNTHVVGEGLTAALVKAKVMPEMLDAVKALIQTKFKGEVGDNDGKPFAKFDGKAVDEFVTGWSQSDEGKRFITADSNSGGGSNGTNGNGKASTGNNKTMARSEFMKLPPGDQSKFSIDGGVLTD